MQSEVKPKNDLHISRKIGLRTLFGKLDVYDRNTILGAINEIASFIRDIVVKTHLFLMFYVYRKLNNGEVLPKRMYTKLFLYAVFQLIVRRPVTRNQVVKEELARDLKAAFDDANGAVRRDDEDQPPRSLHVPLIHGSVTYSAFVSNIMDTYATSFVSRVVEDITQWMANLYSLRVQECDEQIHAEEGLAHLPVSDH